MKDEKKSIQDILRGVTFTGMSTHYMIMISVQFKVCLKEQ